jgi:hypothetical protein
MHAEAVHPSFGTGQLSRCSPLAAFQTSGCWNNHNCSSLQLSDVSLIRDVH